MVVLFHLYLNKMGTAVHLIILSFLPLHLLLPAVATPPKITAVFGFGDSLLDAGNNNHIPTVARSNHRPYGISFVNQTPTGRFSDGKVPTDILASKLGIKPLVPAYLNPATTDEDLLSGVTFASGCSGLDDLTSKLCAVATMEKQLDYFRVALRRMRQYAGEKEVNSTVGKSLFLIAVANNDVMITKYIFGLRRKFTITQYHDFLLKRMEDFIRGLHSVGARKIAVLGLPPVGCLPMMMIVYNLKHIRPTSNLTCIDKYNVDSQAYNAKLRTLISLLSASLPATKLVYVDIYSIVLPMIQTPTSYGFKKSNESCCGKDKLAVAVLCNKDTPVCTNPSEYLFWDSAHPTQTAYTIVVQHFIETDLPKLL